MRIVSWSLAVSAALFVSGIVFIVAAARTTQTGQAAEPADAARIEPVPVANVKQIMNGITGPAARTIYGAVGTVVSARGIEETAPKNDEEWTQLADTAAALAESGNLLLIGPRVLDSGDWVTITREMIAETQGALKAAQAKDPDAILTAGAKINATCDNCHAKYARQ